MGFRGCRRGGYQPPGGFCSRRGRFHGGCAPHCVVAKSAQLCFRLRRKLRPLPCSSSPHRAGRGGGPFWSCPKRECAAPGGREKGAKRAPVQWPSARDGGRRIGASADLGLPSGTLQSSARSLLPSRGGWCGGRRGARTHLTSFSFRAFRFATRWLGGCGGSCFRADALVRLKRPIGRVHKVRPVPRAICPAFPRQCPGRLLQMVLLWVLPPPPAGPGLAPSRAVGSPPRSPGRRAAAEACTGGPMKASAPTGTRKDFGLVWYTPLRPPRERVAKRNARKEKQLKCVLAPRRGRHHPARDGSRRNRRRLKRARRQGKIGAGTDTPTPVQQLCTHVQSCDQKRFFLFHRARRILFLSRTKREWGAHPRGNGPLREQTPPWPPSGGPKFLRAVDHRPMPPPWPGGPSPGRAPRRGRGCPARCPPPRCWSRRCSGRTSW